MKFKSIKGYEGLYEISKTGVVKSLRRNKIMKQKIDKYGYAQIFLMTRNHKRKCYTVHRLVLQTFKPTNKKLQVNHKDGNKLNNNLNNLEWCTNLQNIRHAIKNGLRNPAKGNQLPHTKLTEKYVKKIRKMYATGRYQQVELAKLFNVGKNAIWHIIHKTTWKWLK